MLCVTLIWAIWEMGLVVAHLGPLKKQTGPFGKKQITHISKFPLFEWQVKHFEWQISSTYFQCSVVFFILQISRCPKSWGYHQWLTTVLSIASPMVTWGSSNPQRAPAGPSVSAMPRHRNPRSHGSHCPMAAPSINVRLHQLTPENYPGHYPYQNGSLNGTIFIFKHIHLFYLMVSHGKTWHDPFFADSRSYGTVCLNGSSLRIDLSSNTSCFRFEG